jgi:type IV secretion system protein VirB2
MALTALEVRSAKGRERPYKVSDSGGLYAPMLAPQRLFARSNRTGRFKVSAGKSTTVMPVIKRSKQYSTSSPDFAHRAKAFPLLHIPHGVALSREDSGASEVFIRSIWKGLAAFFGVVWAIPAAAQDAMADPAGSGVIVSAVRWLEGTLLGTIATVVAVIAVASVGLLMLTGRINWRYGATVILGCFILFGAASIVAGIQSTAQLGQ